MSFIYPNRGTLTGSITDVYQYNTNTGPLFGLFFRFFPPKNDAEHQLMLYTRNEKLIEDVLPSMKPIPVTVDISSEGIGFELLDIKILS